MPAAEADTISHVENSLRASLKGGSQSGISLTQSITSSVKKALLDKVEFTPAEKSASLQIDNLRTKYTSLNPSGATPQSNGNHVNGGSPDGVHGKNRPKICHDEMPEPKIVLYSPEKVHTEWLQTRRIGPGIQNMGNTCFMNSVLQCLTYTPPFANYILSGEHKKNCRHIGFCAFCEIGNHIVRALNGHETVIRPMVILRNLRYLAKDMSWGKQEDSHEFLRLVLDNIQKLCCKGIPNLDSLSKETTVVNQIFGGFLRSQVLCLRCRHKSSIYEPFMDLSLDIKNVTHIQRALERFVHPDQLDGKNAYKCSNCKNMVPAQKRFSVHRAPNILTLQLKRFQFGGSIFGGNGKMTKHIAFQNKLDLRPYMSTTKGEPVMYRLYAVICHSGYSCNSGHYFAYVNAPNGVWHVMNDSQVNQCQLGRVMSAEAYMLFYLKTSGAEHRNLQKPGTGFKLQNHADDPKSTAKKDFSQRAVNKSVTNDSKPLSVNPNVISQAPATNIIPAAQRDKVSFGIKLPNQQKQNDAKTGPGTSKPRIVMHIKSGKVVSLSPNKAAGVNGNSALSKLVPYMGESDSEEEVSPNSKENEIKKVENKGPTKQVLTGKKDQATEVVSSESKQKPVNRPNEIHIQSLAKELKSKEIHTDRVRSPPKRQGILKRSLSADGPLTVNICPHKKLNTSSGSWQVSDKNVAQSPSLASECSNSSVNSTTEWNVIESKDIPRTPVIPEAQYPGWKVSPSVGSSKSQTATKELTSSCSRSVGQTSNKYSINTVDKSTKNFRETKENRENSEHVRSDVKTLQGESDVNIKNTKKFKPVSGDIENLQSSDQDDDLAYNRPVKVKKNKKERRSSEDSVKKYKEKHKKKKKKHKHEDKEPLLSSSDSDSDYSRKRRRHDSAKKSKLVWVEKTKESLEKCKTSDYFRQDKECSAGQVKPSAIDVNATNFEVKEREKDKEKYRDSGKTTESRNGHLKPSTWDGTRSGCDVVKELSSMSAFGFGEKVQSWDGGISSVDKEVERDRMMERKRRYDQYDEYEEELDAGRVKKVKRPDYSRNNNHFGNPFQRLHDDRNHTRNRTYSSPGGYYNDRRDSNDRHGYKRDYDRHRHHSYYEKNRQSNGYRHGSYRRY